MLVQNNCVFHNYGKKQFMQNKNQFNFFGQFLTVSDSFSDSFA